jgi:hypothetical protein
MFTLLSAVKRDRRTWTVWWRNLVTIHLMNTKRIRRPVSYKYIWICSVSPHGLRHSCLFQLQSFISYSTAAHFLFHLGYTDVLILELLLKLFLICDLHSSLYIQPFFNYWIYAVTSWCSHLSTYPILFILVHILKLVFHWIPFFQIFYLL